MSFTAYHKQFIFTRVHEVFSGPPDVGIRNPYENRGNNVHKPGGNRSTSSENVGKKCQYFSTNVIRREKNGAIFSHGLQRGLWVGRGAGQEVPAVAPPLFNQPLLPHLPGEKGTQQKALPGGTQL